MATKRKDGRWIERFTLEGKRYTVYGATKKEAIQKAREKQEKLESQKYVKSADLTLDQYHERWERARIGVVKETTLRGQKFEYAHISSFEIDGTGKTLGSMKIIDIESQNVRDLQNYLVNKKQKDRKTPKYKPHTINDIMNHFKHILNDAIKERIITWNPCCAVPNLKTEHRVKDNIHRALTNEETKLFLEEAEKSWYYDVFRFALYSGCRQGEIGALRYTDIDYKKGVIHIERTLTRNMDGTYSVGSDAKTNSGKRDIPITDNLKEIIEHQKKMSALLFGNVQRIDSFLFQSTTGEKIHNTTINREIQRICKQAKVERFTIHALRHTFATRCVESGMNIKTLQEILGHADFKITMNTYSHVLEDTKTNEMNMVKIVI